MNLMFEKVLPNHDASWRYWLYEIDELPFCWHYHPEYEIALTLNSHGKRYVGDSIEDYRHLDLVLLGPHVPHSWCSDDEIRGQQQQVYVAQMPVQWLDSLVFSMPDLQPIKDLLQHSHRGIVFSEKTASLALNLFKAMEQQTPSQRFIALMQLLQAMIEDKKSRQLSTSGYQASTISDESSDKLDKIIHYIYQHYTAPIKAETVAKLVHMSTNHFHRFIKQRTEQTFTEIVNQLRVSRAAALLINTRKPISTIGDTCGFTSASNFNKRFVQHKGMTASQFRKLYIKRISP